MFVVCQACGSKNRENAKFCIGCASQLPGFLPTGSSALQAMKTWRPAPRPARLAPATGPSLPLLPAETSAFWLRLGVLVLMMSIGFVGWYVYVTRKADASLLPAQLMTKQEKAPAPSAEMPSAATVTTPPTPASAMSALAALQIEMPAAAPPVRTAVAPQQATRTRAAPASPARRVRAQDPRGDEDLDRPTASGPGLLFPLLASPPPPERVAADPGPPIAAGPGPLFDSSRMPPVLPELPVRPAADPGPPIAIGPGPLYNPNPNPVRAPRQAMTE